MNLFTILERCRENAEKWEQWAKDYKEMYMSQSGAFSIAAMTAAQDWRTLESEILASIDEEQEGMLKQNGEAPAR